MRPAIYGLLLLLPACGAAFADQNAQDYNLGTETPDTFAFQPPPPASVLDRLAAPANDPQPDPDDPAPNALVNTFEAYRACVDRLVDALWRTRGEPEQIVRNAQARCARQRTAYLAAAVASARSRGDANPEALAADIVGADDDRLEFDLGTEVQQRRYPENGMYPENRM